jgi:hypothetical protein
MSIESLYKVATLLATMLMISTGSYAQQPTFINDIAPIIQTKCTPCHKPGEAAPFSLITYEDVVKRASFIKEVVQKKYMPPWKADNHYVAYANDRSLSNSEIAKIVKWVNNKTPKGSIKSKEQDIAIPLIEGTAYKRKPDIVLKASSAYKLPGDNYERFIVYKIPFELPDSAGIEAVEFFCDNKKIIHHVNYAVHEVPAEIDINSGPDFVNLTEDDRSKYAAYIPFKKTITYYGGWIPGSSYESYPKGVGWVMPKRGVVLLTVHYAPSAKEETSISGVNFFFSKTPVQRKVKVISFGSGGIGEEQIRPPLLIPPNVVRTYKLQIKNPGEDFSAMYVWPHMHYLGKSFLAYGLTPLGDTIRLTSVPQWDFRWQEIYKFKKFVRIPRGTVVHIEGTFDNTASNPFNPNSPPQFVYSSGDMRSKDEMLTLLLIFLPYKEGDENIPLTD